MQLLSLSKNEGSASDNLCCFLDLGSSFLPQFQLYHQPPDETRGGVSPYFQLIVYVDFSTLLIFDDFYLIAPITLDTIKAVEDAWE